MAILIVSGLSGAGKSNVIKVLEDINYYCIDNLPPQLLLSVSELKYEKIAVVIDTRSRDQYDNLLVEIKNLKNHNISYQLLFLYCDKEEILNRYKYTRRTHPLVSDKNPSLTAAIDDEMKMCQKVMNESNTIIDTTYLTVSKLRKIIIENYSDGNYNGLTLKVMSFGFKNGIPADADLLFDVRCMPNPYYVEELKNHSGLEKCIDNYVFAYEQSNVLLDKLLDLIKYSIPYYKEEGKNELVIAIGCTGGHHRSVAFVERIAKNLEETENKVIIIHRDLEKEY